MTNDTELAAHRAAEALVAYLSDHGLTVACAESLTAGLAAATLAHVPGASAVLRGGVVTYATDTKHDVLAVSDETLATVGPISRQCAEEMANNVRELFGADWGLSFTGVAGPDSQDGHPVGEVWIGLADPDGWSVALRAYPPRHHRWVLLPGEPTPTPLVDGDRNTIRLASVEYAFTVFESTLRQLHDDETGNK
ncbi:MAG: CinA family protein [Corynebacterium sp.]|nr:CinA family protein [Corynebacterium sp.]